MTNSELLKVLDLPEEEQWPWLWAEGIWTKAEESLADLAFRLRDEAYSYCNSEVWELAVTKVANRAFGDWLGYDLLNVQGTWICLAQPIHWIIAAVIAKGIADDKSR